MVLVGDIGISSITLSELRYGVSKNRNPEKNGKALDGFIPSLEIPAFDEHAARAYGEIRALLEKAGTPIGSMDLLIAACICAGGAGQPASLPRQARKGK